MKTTYVLDHKELTKLTVSLLPQKKYVDYFFNRNKMIRWGKNTNKFVEFSGLIDIGIVSKLILDPKETKKQINRKNVTYLVRRTQLSEYFFQNVNEYGIIWYVSAEDVKNTLTLINEYHIVFDTKIDKTPPFSFKNVFYGNIFDYLEIKASEENIN